MAVGIDNGVAQAPADITGGEVLDLRHDRSSFSALNRRYRSAARRSIAIIM
jgi:hypothetical protein